MTSQISKTTHIHFNNKGDETSRDSETFDFLFLEGAPCGKRIPRNDAPLTLAEAAKEQEKLNETARTHGVNRRHAASLLL